MKTIDIVALGELLIDFTEAGVSANGQKLFEQNPGGAPANLLTAASRMGLETAFIGKVGNDMHGAFLKKTLQNEGINTDNLIEDGRFFTTLAFVELDDNGERHFSFARNKSADTMLEASELNAELLTKGKIFHFGSLSLTDEPARTATLKAVRIARDAGAIISYDPNYRELLWKDKETAVDAMKSVLENVDLLKVSDEESELLTGENDPETAALILLSMGPKVVSVTLGKDGAIVAADGKAEIVKGFTTEAVDTTGAGDAYWGGFLSSYLEKNIEEITLADLCECAKVGNAVAALNVGSRGGIPAMPYKNAVEKLLK